MPQTTRIVLEVDWVAVLATVLALTVIALLTSWLRAFLGRPKPGLSEDGLVLTLTPEQGDELMRQGRRTLPPSEHRP